jgi:hypothetical protein
MSRTLLALTALAALTPSLTAAEPEPGSPLALIQTSARVRKELKLTEKQAKAVQSVEDEATLAKLLDAEQMKRLTQLSYQRRGGAAILDEAVQKALSLDEGQKMRIADIWKNKELNLQMKLKVARFKTPEDRSLYILNNRREAGEEVLRELTEDQKKKFAALQGK